MTNCIETRRDSFGRSTGYTHTKGDATQQTVTTAYGADGRISGAGFLHGGQEKLFTYGYLQGSHLLQTLTKPNGMTLTQTYESTATSSPSWTISAATPWWSAAPTSTTRWAARLPERSRGREPPATMYSTTTTAAKAPEGL